MSGEISQYKQILSTFRTIAKCTETNTLEYCLDNLTKHKSIQGGKKKTNTLDYHKYIGKIRKEIF